ncbi:MAG: hypothetical protein QN183_13835 [Armatimonadota bacterium]|nr:hypothetical protein [Armatimonadota bacterium]
MPHQALFTTIASGATLSDVVPVIGADLFGLWAPAVTSGQVYLQGSWDPVTNFVRLTNPAGSGDWAWALGPGQRAVTLQDVAFPFPFLRLESSVAQTDTRTFVVIVKLRR